MCDLITSPCLCSGESDASFLSRTLVQSSNTSILCHCSMILCARELKSLHCKFHLFPRLIPSRMVLQFMPLSCHFKAYPIRCRPVFSAIQTVSFHVGSVHPLSCPFLPNPAGPKLQRATPRHLLGIALPASAAAAPGCPPNRVSGRETERAEPARRAGLPRRSAVRCVASHGWLVALSLSLLRCPARLDPTTLSYFVWLGLARLNRQPFGAFLRPVHSLSCRSNLNRLVS